ncbi:hypothetical protein AGLY_009098, partial [Aphis glycines]
MNEEVNTIEDDTNDYVAESFKSSENETESLKIQNYLLDGKYYKILSVEGAKISAACQLCSKKIISYSNSTGNLLSHYKLVHSTIMSKVKEYKILKMSGNSKKENLKQTKLYQSGSNKSCSKQEVNDLVFEYIVCEMRPLATVEKRSFKKLILGLTKSNDESIIPNRKQMLKLLKNSYNSYVSMLSDLIQKSKYICTTADIWSANNKSYLGMTCHFIDSVTYERKSVLGCKRITGSHTYLNITETMACMTQEYNIHYSKISHVVTDSASNFAKAFKTFSKSVKPLQSTTLSIGDLNEDVSPLKINQNSK